MLNGQDQISAKIHEAENGAEVLHIMSKFDYDIILLDVKMPKTTGLAVIKNLHTRCCQTPIIALCSLDEKEFISQVIKTKVNGVILKSSGAEELVKAIKTVLNGERYFCNEVAQIILSGQIKKSKYSKTESLTKREKQVLNLLIKELSTGEIADMCRQNRAGQKRYYLHYSVG